MAAARTFDRPVSPSGFAGSSMGLRLLGLFLLLGLAPLGCGEDADDDDSVSDDDDLANDDDAAGDDDDSAAGAMACDGSLPIVWEEEDNGTVKLANHIGELPDEGFCIEGVVRCGDLSYEDLDLFLFRLPVSRDVRFNLRWGGAADLDRYVWEASRYDPDSDDWVIGFQDGGGVPENQSAVLEPDLDYLIEVACWSGSEVSYAMDVTYLDLNPLGDDDDSAGDDDDSAGDDDDSVGDDDDSASGPSTWTDVYVNVISPFCSCHAAGSTGGWSHNNSPQAGYAAFVGVPSAQSAMNRVTPGNSTQSYLMHKLDGTQATAGGSGSQMPRNQPELPASLRDMVREWIDAGAMND